LAQYYSFNIKIKKKKSIQKHIKTINSQIQKHIKKILKH
jgi:hypothetical protein